MHASQHKWNSRRAIWKACVSSDPVSSLIILKKHTDALSVVDSSNSLQGISCQHSFVQWVRLVTITHLCKNMSNLQDHQLGAPFSMLALIHGVRHNDFIQCTGVNSLNRITT